MRGNKYVLLMIAFLGSCFMLSAQNTGLHFEQINYDEDFSSSMISGIVQNKKGFIWIGTENGLFRYDGYSFSRYMRNKEVANSLSNNHVNVIFEDSGQNLWIGTNHGVNLFRKNSNDFLQVDVSTVKGGRNYISCFAEDGNKTVWIGTFGGVKRLNKKNNLLDNIKSDSNFILNQSRVLSLFYDKDYGVIVGTSTGVKCFDPLTTDLKKLPDAITKNAELLNAKVWKVIKENNGDLWLATETKGTFLYSKSANVVYHYEYSFNDSNSISSNWINDIIIADANTVWFATKDGLSIYNKSTKNFTRYKHNPLSNYSLTDNDVKCFLKDRHGCIWLGTSAGGINFYNKANANFTKIGEAPKPGFGLNNAIVSALAKENNNALWVGTYGGGLNYLDLKNKISTSYIVDNKDEKKTKNLIVALVNRGNYVLCGTYNGLFKFDKSNKKFTPVPLSANGKVEDERPITSILADGTDIWVGTHGNGIKRVLQNGSVENYRDDESENSLSDNFVMDIENRPNGIWIATQNGLNFFDKKLKKVTRLYRTSTPKRISNNSLTTLFTDSKGRLWVGADYDGLFCMDEAAETFFDLNKARGFTDAAIKGITEDAEGNLWVSSEDVLYRIKIKASAKLKLSDFEITRYSAKDGVNVKQFSYNCGLKLNSNQLVFGASKGLTIFNPKAIVKSPNDTEIVLTKLIVNNEVVEPAKENSILSKPFSETDEITINYDQGYIGIEFSSLNFINPKKSKYAYKLDNDSGKDEWHTTGTQNRINISNLAPGTYVLSLKSTNEDSSWNTHIKELKINVLPPWWRTWWAYLIYTMLAVLAGYVVVRIINNRLKLKRKLFLEHVESERKQEIFNMQLNFFTNISHEIRTPLTLIKGPVEELLASSQNDKETEDRLKTIQQNSDRLLKLVNELLDFRKAEKGHMRLYCEKQDIVSFCFEIFESFKGIAAEKNIEYKFVLNTNAIHVYFDKNQMEKVVFNLLSNAFKFTRKNGKIVFAVEQGTPQENKVYIRVKDNGIGIPESSKNNIFNRFFQADDRGVHSVGSGIGLALSKNIVELHKGEISIPEDKESWAHTVFQIALQLGDKHLSNEQIVENNSNANTYLIDAENVPPKAPVVFEDEIKIVNDDFDEDKKTVMVVEDNDEVRKFIFNVLKAEYNVVEFCNGKEAVVYLEKEIPDLVVSDIMMPEMDGLELCRYIKTNETTNHIPVVLLTAKASTDNKIEGLSTGADAYVSKPFSIKVLRLTVENLLSSKEALRLKYSGNFIIDADLNKLSTPEEQFIKKLMKVIENNLENPDFDVNMLVNEIGMSRTILYKKVNALTGQSVANLIKNLRLKKASDIILNTSYPISEVAFMVGFNDRKHFSREFRKVYKLSPTEYKTSKE
ncbi:response regulator [Flavobacterium sp. Sd200]|uniref:hybrid sensor histidine kinase/response regulator transcription factor n=1 Tax=Flavobacterium sp. Sd200 TaxID=2692211 RepID=UPI00136808E7|nr:two-component regulator propeller domain-containing protein [Flavobacterium sp. Sd200]MXN90600.1 response regulator [Flavobacterium sp. Sd200]